MTSNCSNTTDKISIAKKHAGDNWYELQKVIDYYEKPEDSLKRKAAIFLIENMPYHYSYAGDEIGQYYDEIIPILNLRVSPSEKMEKIQKISLKYPHISQHTIEDIKVIKADYLIKNIETAFKDWTRKKNNRHLTFEQFCEFLLPYKMTELQSLDHWRDTLKGKFSTNYINNSASDDYDFSLYKEAESINSELRDKIKQTHLQGNYYSLLSASTLYKTPFGTCDDYSLLAAAVLRSEGVPVVNEYFPNWGRMKSGHSWYTTLNIDGNVLPFYWGLDSSPGASFFIDDPVPKVYRTSYVVNERNLNYLQTCRHIVFNISAFHKDVTSEYISTSNLSIPVFEELKNVDNWAYIAVFDNQNWVIVDFGTLKRKKAQFENIGRNILYMVFGYNGFGLKPISYPFILHTDGDIQYLIPDDKKIKSIELNRKYPKDKHTLLVESRIVNGKIQAANRKDFSDSVTLHTIGHQEKSKLIDIHVNKPYRYWRFLSPGDSYCNIAELQFYEKDSDTLAIGDIIGTLDIYENDTAYNYTKAFDGDWLTYFSYNRPYDGWIGIDMKKPVYMDKVRCVPRSDDNGIRTGDEYELLYWERKGWKSLGRKTGVDNVINFDSVPHNSLLLLKNHTRGVEERFFTYENGKQIWW